MDKSDAELVREFTAAAGGPTPNVPERMNKEETFFLIKMVLDELIELASTVAHSDEYKEKMVAMIDDAKDVNIDFQNMSKEDIIAEQADFVIDSYIYCLNAMAKKGINCSKIFKLVHASNMTKIDPTTGKCIKRADGKILKPPTFRVADVVGEIRRQMKYGAFDL